MDIDALLAALAPHLVELIAALATAIIGWLAAQAKARWGLEIEARHREALHSALMTGVRHALSEGVQGRTASHARQSTTSTPACPTRSPP